MSKEKPESIPLKKIRLDGETQSREELNDDVIAEYAELIEQGVEFPPIGVVFDGKSYWLWDGYHRRYATVKAGRESILCVVTKGSKEDARWLSYGANKDHGLHRGNRDKARAVLAALRHPKGAMESDRKIAEHVGVSHVTVAKYREQLESSGQIYQIDVRTVTREGVTYEQNTANIGRSSDGDLSTSVDSPDDEFVNDLIHDEPAEDLDFEGQVKHVNARIEAFCKSLVMFYQTNCPQILSVSHMGRFASALSHVKAACATLRTCKLHDEPCPTCQGEGCARCEKESDFGAVTVLTYKQLAG